MIRLGPLLLSNIRIIMGLFAVIGVILIAVGFLALFSILSLSQPIALVLIVIGVLLVVFGGRFTDIRR